MNGTDLLREFREGRSEEAFRELMRRYTNLVFAVAKRRVGNVSLAEEITQLVFIRLAKAAPRVGTDAELAAWLHRTTVHASIDLWRSEIRRRNRENLAVAMQTDPNDTVPWNDLAPVLDDAVNELGDADRQAIVLRFFADKSMRDVGATLGVSEDAAKMRVSRALERLRNFLGARGVSCGAVALAAMLSEHGVEAAPAHLGANFALLKIPVPATSGLSTAVMVGVASLLLTGAGFWFFREQKAVTVPTGAVAAEGAATAVEASNQQPTEVLAASGDPDPLQLLQAVARARERITSGIMEYYAFSENTHWGPRATNHRRFSATFENSKLRFESFQREYRYVGVGAEGEASAAKMKELGLDQEAAVQAGLLEPFESHHVIVRDGAVVMDYWETDRKPNDTTISDETNYHRANVNFDPRMLGITAWLRTGSVSDYMGHPNAKSIKLLGKELVEGNLAWHIQLESKHGDTRQFWLQADHPIRVLKHASGDDVVMSKYDGRSAIPAEVIIKSPKSAWHIQQTNAHLNVAVDPSTFTLAGLRMKQGTAVNDSRISRRIGYWTGSGLSDQPPPKNAKPGEVPKLEELVALLEQNPTSGFAMDAAIWILLNTPDGPAVEKAAEVIIEHHIERPELLKLCEEQDRVRHRSSKRLLEALLERNPSADIKAMACFNLAKSAKDHANHGLNKEATAEADKLFERVVREFPKFNQRHNAKWALEELRRMAIGQPAPPLEGVDMEGNQVRLSDYRGKVVLVYFWSSDYSHPEEHHKLVAAMANKPFAILGVTDNQKLDKVQAAIQKHNITWPSIWEGSNRPGPIHSNWYVRKWPSTYIVDQEGVIRYRDLRWFGELEKALNSLLK